MHAHPLRSIRSSPRGLHARDRKRSDSNLEQDQRSLFKSFSNIFIRLYYTQRDRCVIMYRRDFDICKSMKLYGARRLVQQPRDLVTKFYFFLYSFSLFLSPFLSPFLPLSLSLSLSLSLVIIYYQQSIQHRYTLSLFVRCPLNMYIFIHIYVCMYLYINIQI